VRCAMTITSSVGVQAPLLCGDAGGPHGAGSGVTWADRDDTLGWCVVRRVQEAPSMADGMGMHDIGDISLSEGMAPDSK
jgi:hypothetical protein